MIGSLMMTSAAAKPEGYTLVICEKPDAAKRVAEALVETKLKAVKIGGTTAFQFRSSQREFMVCAALGHLYAVSDSFRRRDIYPVFELDWFPSHLVDKTAKQVQDRIVAIGKLATGAKEFINACDFDVEGETIGYNILRYACGGKEETALRAKFSTLTKDELVSAFKEAQPGLGKGLADAGRTRHVVDFMWGVNLSRALSESVLSASNRYKTVSIGRVQGPTLSAVVEREIGIRTFVPTPYWTVTGVFDKNGLQFDALYGVSKVLKRAEAESVKKACLGKEAFVADLKRSVFKEAVPAPFNIGDLQKEAYRVFGYSPSRTLQIAERLYLQALISYPRTSSQKIPPSINYRKILDNLAKYGEYHVLVNELTKREELRPHEGEKGDPAHPAVYPTSESPRRLESWTIRLYDLIVRRFLATFASEAIRERVTAEIKVDGHLFRLSGRRTLNEGWIKYYKKYTGIEDRSIPRLQEGDLLKVLAVDYEEKFERQPPRYNQSSLLEMMENEGIGTKATRAEIISTLVNRGYVVGDSLVATDLGFSVIETMQKHSPQVISTELTRRMEKRLEEVELGNDRGSPLVRETMTLLSGNVASFKSHENDIGRIMNQSIVATAFEQNLLGACPVCKTGRLRIIRLWKTHKRFVGCTNYGNGCRASAPLPQKGLIKTTTKMCMRCGWPIVYVKLRRIPWRLCVNLDCPSKSERRKNELPVVQERD